MSKYSDPITATGSLITLDAPYGGIFDSLSVPITPTQDLHGYSSPWPAGGGVNKLLLGTEDYSGTTTYGINYSYSLATETLTVSGKNTDASAHAFYSRQVSAGHVKISANPTAGDTYYFGAELPAGTYAQIVYTKSGGGIAVLKYIIASGIYSGTIPNDFAGFFRLDIGVYSSATISGSCRFLLTIGSTAPTSWTPYANICPISGRTGLSVYVSPTSQQAQATEYAVSFGSTVYAGFVDPITGEVKERPQYQSYNGEALVGPWLSSMDEYAVGVTPTTGAQVVDLGGSLVTASITPVDISMREGSNNVWVDTSAVITLIYRLLQVDRQTDRTSIGKRAESLEVLGKFSSVSKVEVNVTENLFYEAGDSSGRTLTVDCPFGTQAMANNLLAMLQGYVYQPFEARRSIANPATELGDGVTVGDVYGGIYAIYHKCGPLHLADLSAPADEEIDHEYKFTPAFERKVERRLNNMQSELSVQAGEISAKVDRQGGDPSSVSWKMDADVFKVAVDGSDVLTVNENGLTVNGDGNFTGNVQAKNIQYGGSAGTMSGNGITSRSIGTGRLTSGINTSLGNADYSADVFSGAVTANYLKGRRVEVMGGQSFYVYGKQVVWSTINYKNHAGVNSTVKALIQGGVNP